RPPRPPPAPPPCPRRFFRRVQAGAPPCGSYQGGPLLSFHGSPSRPTSPRLDPAAPPRACRPGADGAPEGEWLDRFRRGRDEEAFAALLRRHGPGQAQDPTVLRPVWS